MCVLSIVLRRFPRAINQFILNNGEINHKNRSRNADLGRVNLQRSDVRPEDRADLARFLREAIEADRYPLSPRVRRLKELLARIDPRPRRP
jgi:hypothetical protein